MSLTKSPIYSAHLFTSPHLPKCNLKLLNPIYQAHPHLPLCNNTTVSHANKFRRLILIICAKHILYYILACFIRMVNPTRTPFDIGSRNFIHMKCLHKKSLAL